jgi:hypothetical protein
VDERTPADRGRAERIAPGANDLFSQLSAQMRTPGVVLAGLSALIGAAVCLVFGLLLAIVLPDSSYIAIGGGSGLIEQTLAQAVSFSQANMSIPYGDVGVRTVPVLFVLIPILGVAAGVAALAPRTHGMQVRERLLWAAGAGVPFALLMAIFCLSAGEIDFVLLETQVKFSAGSVLLLSLLWGSLGGVLGMLYDLRKRHETLPLPMSLSTARFARAVGSALRPLLLALAIVGVLGTAAWIVQVTREDAYRFFPERSTAVAVAEQVAYAGDHAINILPLGAGANEELEGLPALPIPTEDFSELGGERSSEDPFESTFNSYNLFDYNGTMPTLLFLLTLVVLIGAPALLALYGGFAVARQVGEARPERAAAWGALVGPVWSLAMVLLTTLARKGIAGNPSGDSVFIAFLLGGAVFGALGGFLAARANYQEQ